MVRAGGRGTGRYLPVAAGRQGASGGVVAGGWWQGRTYLSNHVLSSGSNPTIVPAITGVPKNTRSYGRAVAANGSRQTSFLMGLTGY